MKYSKSEIRDQKTEVRTLIVCLCVLVVSIFTHLNSYANQGELKLKAPIQENEPQENIPSLIDINTIPNFPKADGISGGKRIPTGDTTISLNTPLQFVVDSFVDSRTAMIGDYFKAHLLEDYYASADIPQLILPKGSWLRGRISSLKRPNFFNKTAKIGIQIDQLVSPLGDVLVLDAELDVQKGIPMGNGFLQPSIVKQPTSIVKQPNQQFLPGSIPVSANNVGPSLVENLLSGKLYALFSQGDSITLTKGQELQIPLQQSIQINPN